MSEFQKWTSQHRTIRASRDWNALLDHGLEKPASYIIRKNGNYYEAINGSTGKIDYGGANNAGGVSGTDATAVIQSTIQNVGSFATIYVKGDISLTSTITFDFNNNNNYALNFYFETLRIDHDGNGFNITSATRDINIYGINLICKDDYSGYAFYINHASGVKIDVNYVYHLGTVQTGSAAIALVGDSGTVYGNKIHIGKIYGFYYAIYLTTKLNSATVIYANEININHIQASTIGVYLCSDSAIIYGNKITVGHIKAPSIGIYLHGYKQHVEENSIEVKTIESASDTAVKLYSEGAGGSSSGDIFYNTIRVSRIIDPTNYGIYLLAGAQEIFSNEIKVFRISGYGINAVRIELGTKGGNNILRFVTDAPAGKTAVYNDAVKNNIFEEANISDVAGTAINNAGKLTCIGTQWALSNIVNTGTIYYVNHWDGSKTITRRVDPRYENCGSTVIPANTKSHQVSFEMAGTPTVVKVTPQFDVSGRWWISNLTWASGTSILSGAFTFNRTYSGLYSGIIHWNAEYIP